MTQKEKKKRTWFARPDRFGTRMVMMLAGITLQAFGLSLLMRINLGTDPCSCLTQGVIRHVPISFGTAQLLCHLVTFAFVIRFDLSMIGFGTIGNMVCLGYIADFFTFVWNRVLPPALFESTAVRFGLLLPVLAVFILGAAAYMTAGLGTSPYDALPFIIADRTKRLPFKPIRMLWDIAFTTGGFLLGGDAGVVTICVAFFLGPVISAMQKKLAVILREDEKK